mmetsp:Transcript_19958/g.61967  ORF Transcript_19958/g.61967 Transcript_19958/m.61967 type:complete len:217 (-) Transcript_19958:2299-2949(-)
MRRSRCDSAPRAGRSAVSRTRATPSRSRRTCERSIRVPPASFQRRGSLSAADARRGWPRAEHVRRRHRSQCAFRSRGARRAPATRGRAARHAPSHALRQTAACAPGPWRTRAARAPRRRGRLRRRCAECDGHRSGGPRVRLRSWRPSGQRLADHPRQHRPFLPTCEPRGAECATTLAHATRGRPRADVRRGAASSMSGSRRSCRRRRRWRGRRAAR